MFLSPRRGALPPFRTFQRHRGRGWLYALRQKGGTQDSSSAEFPRGKGFTVTLSGNGWSPDLKREEAGFFSVFSSPSNTVPAPCRSAFCFLISGRLSLVLCASVLHSEWAEVLHFSLCREKALLCSLSLACVGKSFCSITSVKRVLQKRAVLGTER